MSKFAIFAGIVCLISIMIFMIVGKETGVGGSWSFSFSKWKIPKWVTFSGFLKLIAILFLVYMVIGLGHEGWYFWQPPEHTSRFQIIEETKMVAYIIPEIPAGFENKIVFTRSFGVLCRIKNGEEAEVFFPEATLTQSQENKGEALARRLGNFAFGEDYKEPTMVFEESVTSKQQKGLYKDVVLLHRGDELAFWERGEHKFYVIDAKLGDNPHLYYKLVEIEK